MLADVLPVLALRIRTPRLELRLPDEAELAALADVVAAGIHGPDEMPFVTPWTDQPPAVRARRAVQAHWTALGDLGLEQWKLGFVVLRDGVVLGQQELRATGFAARREVSTGSMLGLAHQGHGIGTEMRAAVLHLAFAGLGAEEARSAAFVDNPASIAVSRKLGYEPDGFQRDTCRGSLAISQRMRLSVDRWRATATVPVELEGVEPCLELLGAPGPAPPA